MGKHALTEEPMQRLDRLINELTHGQRRQEYFAAYYTRSSPRPAEAYVRGALHRARSPIRLAALITGRGEPLRVIELATARPRQPDTY